MNYLPLSFAASIAAVSMFFTLERSAHACAEPPLAEIDKAKGRLFRTDGSTPTEIPITFAPAFSAGVWETGGRGARLRRRAPLDTCLRGIRRNGSRRIPRRVDPPPHGPITSQGMMHF